MPTTLFSLILFIKSIHSLPKLCPLWVSDTVYQLFVVKSKHHKMLKGNMTSLCLFTFMQWLTVSEVIKTDGYLIYMEDHSRNTVELIPWPVWCHWMMNLYELPFKKPFFVIQQPTGSSFDGIVWFTDDIKAFFSCNIGMRRERILVMFHAFWPPCDLIVK